MINHKLQDFEEDVKPIGDIMRQATIQLYNAIVHNFLPTPTNIHYLFNLRDVYLQGQATGRLDRLVTFFFCACIQYILWKLK